jgi:hypothetical protein
MSCSSNAEETKAMNWRTGCTLVSGSERVSLFDFDAKRSAVEVAAFKPHCPQGSQESVYGGEHYTDCIPRQADGSVVH